MSNRKFQSASRSLAIILGLVFLGGAVTASGAKPIKGTWGKAKLEASCKVGGGVSWSEKTSGGYGCSGKENSVDCRDGKCTATFPPTKPKPKKNPK